MKLALCNEVLAPRPFAEQCRIAAALGYAGLEVAPYTVADDPQAMTEADARALAGIAADHGLAITGLHWLLVKPAGLSITTPDAALFARTVAMMQWLVGLCAAMGGTYLVHGSNAQRAVAPGESVATAVGRASEAFAAAGEAARAAGVTYCIEPLSPAQTQVINTIAEAAAIVRAIDNPHLRTMIDASSAGVAEAEPVPDLIRRWMPTGLIAHVQLNDPNRRGPGQGEMRFAPILAALRETGYGGVLAVEPFDYVPDGLGSAAHSIGYLRGLIEAMPASA
ncbi:MAG: sugar phosphate isomerase/epimerase [Burkholderiales bacterium]|nr:sugar phosphate isomerase/epimerase [Burkholderiales bacterium]